LNRLHDILSRPVDIAFLAALRVLYGLAMGVSMLRLIGYGWLQDLFVTPSFHFKYWGFEWLPAPSAASLPLLGWSLAGLALAVALGAAYRLTAPLFVLGFTYLQLVDVTTYLNHYYLASLLGLLLALSPAHRAWSIDSLLRPRVRAGTTAALWLYLFRFQVGLVYTFAGIAKAHSDWLLQGQPLSIWLGSRTDLPVLGWLFASRLVPLVMSWAGFVFDTTIVWWLSWRKTRPFAFAAVLVFHALTRLLFPIGMFPVIMVIAALVFFPPGWPRRPLAGMARLLRSTHITGSGRSRRVSVGGSSQWQTGGQRLRVALAATYCLVQVLLPLRHWGYGGNVRWHEQGMRFSWRVMVREKNGSITYLVRHRQSGRLWHVSPHRYLTPLQEREISGQPDLILQLAHHIERDFLQRGLGPVEVRADALVSLNGRRLRRLIDPNVDLTRVQDGLAKADWILPAPTEPAPRLRPLRAGLASSFTQNDR